MFNSIVASLSSKMMHEDAKLVKFIQYYDVENKKCR